MVWSAPSMMAPSAPPVGCDFRVRQPTFTASTWTGISARTGERRTTEEWLTDSGTLWSKIGSVTKRSQIRTNEVLFHHCSRFSFKNVFRVDHFTLECLVAWPLKESEAGVDRILIETSLHLLCK